MKTPMQELIDRVGNMAQGLDADELYDYFMEKATQMLEKEKEVIMDAHIEGQRVFDKFPHTQWTNDQAEEYYNETFNTKEK